MKTINTEHEVIEVIKERWSPRAFSQKPISKETLQNILEAARWAPSSINAQPWRFIVGVKGEGETYDKILAGLAESNQFWAKNTPVLIVATTKKTFDPNPMNISGNNTHAEYDLGQAVAFLILQAQKEEVYSHEMGGIQRDKLREAFQIPDEVAILSVIALGYLGNPDDLPESLKQRELAESKRKSLNEIVFQDTWETKCQF